MPFERSGSISPSSIHDDDVVGNEATGFDEGGRLPLECDVAALRSQRLMHAEFRADAGLVSRHARMEEVESMPKDDMKKPKQPVELKERVAKQRQKSGDHQPILTEDVQTAERHVKQLLQDFGQTQWRAPLSDLVQECLTQDHFSQLMDFILIPMFEESITKKSSASKESLKKKSSASIDPAIGIPTSSPPTVFTYNTWKRFVHHLGYETEEPDSNNDIHGCCLSLPLEVSLEMLQGVTSLLKAMHEMPLAAVKNNITHVGAKKTKLFDQRLQ